MHDDMYCCGEAKLYGRTPSEAYAEIQRLKAELDTLRLQFKANQDTNDLLKSALRWCLDTGVTGGHWDGNLRDADAHVRLPPDEFAAVIAEAVESKT